ncbi:hypothetical protein RB595_002465 [Gaeumannomyces hyphopodioides]
MDPLSILSIVTAAITFVDFGAKVLAAAKDISAGVRDNETALKLDIAVRDANELEERAGMIERVYEQFESPRGRHVDTQLLKVGSDAVKAARDIKALIVKLGALHGPGGDRQPKISKGAKNVFGPRDSPKKTVARVEALQKTLHLLQERTMQAFIQCLWVNSQESREDFGQVKAMLQKIEEGQQKLHEASVPPDKGLLLPPAASIGIAREQLVRQIWLDGPADFSLDISPGLRVPAHLKGSGADSDLVIRGTILDSLRFGGMEDRERAIATPFRGTFEWIFMPRDSENICVSREASWLDLCSWVREDSNRVYWITGKPAAGKSTLMRHIQQHPALKKALVEWAGGSEVLSGSFYAWNSGSDLQKSENALLRTLLVQYLEELPKLVSLVLPRRWSFYKVFGTGESTLIPWSLSELREGCMSLLALLPESGCKLALFLDGLDELEGEGVPGCILDLVEAFRIAGAKVCVSSRPETEFKDHFGEQLGMTLDEITSLDIRRYVNSNFQSTPAFKILELADAGGLAELIQAIVGGANGVFLWVKLVVEALLIDLKKGDSAQELMTTLNSLSQKSQDLAGLYQGIWDRLDEDDRLSASRFFQIADASREVRKGRMAAVLIFVAEAADPTVAAKQPYRVRMQQLDRRLRSRTKGLLEISTERTNKSRTVEYLHRTTREWVRDNRSQIYSGTPATFDAHLCLLKANVACLGDRCPFQRATHLWNCVYETFDHAARIAVHEDDHPNSLECVMWLDCFRAKLNEREGELVGSLGTRRGEDQWLVSQFLGPESSRPLQCSFVGIAAEFAVLPYVRAKAALDNDRGTRDPGIQLTLLESALYFPTDVKGIPFIGRIVEGGAESSRLKNRLAVIEFLLENGGDPGQEAKLIPTWYGFGNGGFWTLRHCLHFLPSFVRNEPFWKEVVRLFDQKLPDQQPKGLARLWAKAKSFFRRGA